VRSRQERTEEAAKKNEEESRVRLALVKKEEAASEGFKGRGTRALARLP